MGAWFTRITLAAVASFVAVSAGTGGAPALGEPAPHIVDADNEPSKPLDAPGTRIEFERVAQLGGAVLAARVVDGIAYAGVGPRLAIVDMRDPAHPEVLGRSEPLRGLVTDVEVQGSYAYVTHGAGGLSVVSISDLASPHFVSRVRFPGPAVALRVFGNRAYVAASRSGLRVVSVDDPAAPRELGYVHTGWSAVAVDVSDGFAFVAAWTDGLRIVSLAEDEHPRVVGSLDTPEFCRGVQVLGTTVYLADGYGGLRIVSADDRRSPVELGAYEQTTSEPRPRFYANSLTVTGELAYVGGGARIWVIRVADAHEPSLVGFTDDAGSRLVPRLDRGVLYDITSSLVAYSLTDRTHPTPLGVYDSGVMPGAVMAGQGYVLTERVRPDGGAGRLTVVSVANPTEPLVEGTIETTAEPRMYDVDGDLVYLPEGEDGLRIVSVADRSDPVDIGHVPAETEARVVRAEGQYAALAEEDVYHQPTLRVIAVDRPAEPLPIARTDMSTYPMTLLMSGEYLYVGGPGLSTVNMADPLRPREVDVQELYGGRHEISDLQMHDDTLFLWDAGRGRVTMMDVRSPERPSHLGYWDGVHLPFIVSSGLGLHLGWSGVSAIDLAELPEQVAVGAYQPYGLATAAAIVGDHVYVAARDEGLLVLRLSRFPALPEPIDTVYVPSTGLSGR